MKGDQKYSQRLITQLNLEDDSVNVAATPGDRSVEAFPGSEVALDPDAHHEYRKGGGTGQ